MSDTNTMNISPSEVKGKCNYKCSYSFSYPTSSCTAKNQGVRISIPYDKSNTTPVTFNDSKYNVEDVNIYAPSLHLYNGKPASAELVILHSPVSTGQPLHVAIPIISSRAGSSQSSNIIKDIIEGVSTGAPSQGESTTINIQNFTLDEIVPRKMFYSYTDRARTNWIAYPKISAILMDEETITKLSQILKPSPGIAVKSGPSLFVNPTGPSSGVTDGEIYIECAPTGSSEEETDVTTTKESDTGTGVSDFFHSEFFTSLVKILVGCSLFILVLVCANYGVEALGGKKIKFSNPFGKKEKVAPTSSTNSTK